MFLSCCSAGNNNHSTACGGGGKRHGGGKKNHGGGDILKEANQFPYESITEHDGLCLPGAGKSTPEAPAIKNNYENPPEENGGTVKGPPPSPPVGQQPRKVQGNPRPHPKLHYKAPHRVAASKGFHAQILAPPLAIKPCLQVGGLGVYGPVEPTRLPSTPRSIPSQVPAVVEEHAKEARIYLHPKRRSLDTTARAPSRSEGAAKDEERGANSRKTTKAVRGGKK